MRVTADRISVSGKARSLEVFRNADTGDRFSARILDRSGNNRAHLDIHGSRINAEFVRGVPSGRYITLVLTKVTRGALFFRLEDPSTASGRDILGRFTVFTPTGLRLLSTDKKPLSGTGIPSGIFELNHLLSRHLGYEFSDRPSLAVTLNRLRMAGVKIEKLEVFSYLFWNIKGINQDYLLAIVNILGQKERNGTGKRKDSPVKAITDGFMEELTGDIENLLESDRGGLERTLKELLLMAGEGSGEVREGLVNGTLPWFDGEEFRDAELMASRNSLLLRVVFSMLGAVTVFIREQSRAVEISIFCENGNSLYNLKQDIESLRASLSAGVLRNVKLNVYLERLVLEKIIESHKELFMQGGFNHWA